MMQFKQLLQILLINFLIYSTLAQVSTTIVNNRNVLLFRRKRYLAFPPQCNFVITMSLTKSLMEVQPKGYNVLLEMDIPWPLPTDTRFFKKQRRNHYLQRRAILSGLEIAFSENGLNGTACINRLICEAQLFININVFNLLTKEFLHVILKDTTCKKQFLDWNCPISLLDLILNNKLIT